MNVHYRKRTKRPNPMDEQTWITWARLMANASNRTIIVWYDVHGRYQLTTEANAHGVPRDQWCAVVVPHMPKALVQQLPFHKDVG